MGGCTSKSSVSESNRDGGSKPTAFEDAGKGQAESSTIRKSGTNTSAPAATAPPASVEEFESEPISFKTIHSAIRWQKPISEVECLLTSEEAVNIEDTGNGNVPLHIAAQNGHIDHVQLLIRKKANVNLRNKKGNTPLHMAIGYDYIDCAEALLAAGADAEITNDAGHPAKRGIDGDKCIPAIRLALASSTIEAAAALEECSKNVSELDKAGFVSTGLKTKKNLGEQWTKELQDSFKEICSQL